MIVTWAGTPPAAAGANRVRQRPTMGSAAPTGTMIAVCPTANAIAIMVTGTAPSTTTDPPVSIRDPLPVHGDRRSRHRRAAARTRHGSVTIATREIRKAPATQRIVIQSESPGATSSSAAKRVVRARMSLTAPAAGKTGCDRPEALGAAPVPAVTQTHSDPLACPKSGNTSHKTPKRSTSQVED